MLDTNPVKDDGMKSCFDVQLDMEAFGIWKKVGYELMFLDNWKFSFEDEGIERGGIGERGKRLDYILIINCRQLVCLRSFME